MSSGHKEPQNHTWIVDLRSFQRLLWVIRYGLYVVHPLAAVPGHFCSLCFNAPLHQSRVLKNWLGTLNPCEEIRKEGKMHRHKRLQFPVTLYHFPEGIGEGEAAAHFARVQVRVSILKNK